MVLFEISNDRHWEITCNFERNFYKEMSIGTRTFAQPKRKTKIHGKYIGIYAYIALSYDVEHGNYMIHMDSNRMYNNCLPLRHWNGNGKYEMKQ